MDGEQCSPRVRHRLLRHSAAEGRAQNAGGALQREPGEEPLGTSTQQLTRPAHLAAAQPEGDGPSKAFKWVASPRQVFQAWDWRGFLSALPALAAKTEWDAQVRESASPQAGSEQDHWGTLTSNIAGGEKGVTAENWPRREEWKHISAAAESCLGCMRSAGDGVRAESYLEMLMDETQSAI